MIIVLVVLGLILGSFINAWVWRVSQQLGGKPLSILTGRSQCPHCGQQLSPKDLVPILSWLSLRGRCRYCAQPIGAQYPVVEILAGLVFGLSYLWWPGGLHSNADWLQLGTWLAASVGLIALLVYDARWTMLPNKIVYPTLALAVAGRLIYMLAYADDKLHFGLMWLASLVVASGFFWVLYTISKGKWIGYGDVRLGLITGTILLTPTKASLMIFLASVLGSLWAIPLLLSGRQQLSTKLAFGPFLIASTMVILLFGDRFINWYQRLLG